MQLMSFADRLGTSEQDKCKGQFHIELIEGSDAGEVMSPLRSINPRSRLLLSAAPVLS